MDPQVNELTSDIIELCARKLPCKQTLSLDGHIVITVDNDQLLFVEIKHSYQKENSKSFPTRNSSNVPPKKKLFGRRRSSEGDQHQRACQAEEGHDLGEGQNGVKCTKSNKKVKSQEKGEDKVTKRHWKKGRKREFVSAEKSKDADDITTVSDTVKEPNNHKQTDSGNNENKGGKNQRKNKTLHNCDHCSFSTTYKHCLTRHEKRKHSKDSGIGTQVLSPRVICTICGKSFKTKDSLRIHKGLKHSSQGKKYPCSICDKVFYMKVHLDGHLNKHRSERPYKCTLCNKGFLYVQNVKRHEKTCGLHSGKSDKRNPSPIECKACGITFKTRDYYKDHMSAKHSQGPKYKCPVCQKPFRIRGSFYRHKTVCTRRIGLEPGEVNPEIVNNVSRQQESRPETNQSDTNKHLLRCNSTVANTQVVPANHQGIPNQTSPNQTLPNVHQLYHHYRRPNSNQDHQMQVADSTAANQSDGYQRHGEFQPLMHYEIVPHNLYPYTMSDLQSTKTDGLVMAHADTPSNMTSEWQEGHYHSKSNDATCSKTLHDLQPAQIRPLDIANSTVNVMSCSDISEATNTQLEMSQGQRCQVYGYSRKLTYASELYDVTRPPLQQGSRSPHDQLIHSHMTQREAVGAHSDIPDRVLPSKDQQSHNLAQIRLGNSIDNFPTPSHSYLHRERMQTQTDTKRAHDRQSITHNPVAAVRDLAHSHCNPEMQKTFESHLTELQTSSVLTNMHSSSMYSTPINSQATQDLTLHDQTGDLHNVT